MYVLESIMFSRPFCSLRAPPKAVAPLSPMLLPDKTTKTRVRCTHMISKQLCSFARFIGLLKVETAVAIEISDGAPVIRVKARIRVQCQG